MLSLLGLLARTERTWQQLSRLACQFAISFCELPGNCCFVAIHPARASKDKISNHVSAAVDKRRFCGNGPRQWVVPAISRSVSPVAIDCSISSDTIPFMIPYILRLASPAWKRITFEPDLRAFVDFYVVELFRRPLIAIQQTKGADRCCTPDLFLSRFRVTCARVSKRIAGRRSPSS